MKKFLFKLVKSWHIIFLLGTAIGIRIYIFLKMSPGLHNDSITYFFLGEIDTIRTPGYPFFVECILSLNDLFSISSNYFVVLCFAQLFICGVLNCYLIYKISKYLTKSGIFALMMGIIYNFNYFVVGFEFQILSETLSITLLLALIFFYLQVFEKKKNLGVVAGFFLVFLLLARPIFILLGIFLPLVTLIGFFPQTKGKEFFKKFGRSLAIFLLISIAGVLSWSLRNKLKFDYFGISNLMPYQLRYYTNSFFDDYKESGNEKLDRLAAIYAQELKNARNKIRAVDGLLRRGKKEMMLSEAEISSIFLKINLRLIKNNIGKYLAQVPSSISAYYKNYALYWTAGSIRKFINRKRIIPKINRFFFRFYKNLFTNSIHLYILLVIMPILLLIMVRKDKKIFHGWLILVALINYNFIISVLSTNAGVNNLRYRIAVEPLILLVFYATIFYASKRILYFFISKGNIFSKRRS